MLTKKQKLFLRRHPEAEVLNGNAVYHDDLCISPALRRELGLDETLGGTAYCYYEDSSPPTLIHGHDIHPDEVRAKAEDYSSTRRGEIRQVTTLKEWQRLFKAPHNFITLNE